MPYPIREAAGQLLVAGIHKAPIALILELVAYEGPKVEALEALMNTAWDKGTDSDYAGHQVAATRLKVLRTAKQQNERKANELL